LEFKLVIQEESKAFRWEDGDNRILEKFASNEALYEGKFGVTDTANLTQLASGGESRKSTKHLHGVQKADESVSHEAYHNELLAQKTKPSVAQAPLPSVGGVKPSQQQRQDIETPLQQKATPLGNQGSKNIEHGLKKEQVQEQKDQVSAEAVARKR